MADSLYQKIRKERCQWCAKEWKLWGTDGKMHYSTDDGNRYIDEVCTAPTQDQVIEEQAAEIAILCEALEHIRKLEDGTDPKSTYWCIADNALRKMHGETC